MFEMRQLLIGNILLCMQQHVVSCEAILQAINLLQKNLK